MEKNIQFAEGARVAFIGDSITHHGLAVNLIQAYYAEHLPARRVKIFNLGTGGDNAGAVLYNRREEILSYRPTEAVVMFGVNDIAGARNYPEHPDEGILKKRAVACADHLQNMRALCAWLAEHGIAVTLCSAVGRDEVTPGTECLSFGATAALAELYAENCRAIPGLKHTVDWTGPLQTLMADLVALGGPALFEADRTHPNALGQQMMATIFLAAQGFPVCLPTATELLAGEGRLTLPPMLRERHAIEGKLRNLSWVYPHQRACTGEMALCERIAYWNGRAEEVQNDSQQAWPYRMYKFYVDHAEDEAAWREEYLRLTDALYE